MRALANRLREVRHARGLSLKQVEDKSGGNFTAVALGTWERGDRLPPLPRIAALADFYGLQLCDLLPDRGGADRVFTGEFLDGLATIQRVAAALADTVRGQPSDAADTLNAGQRSELVELLRRLRETGGARNAARSPGAVYPRAEAN